MEDMAHVYYDVAGFFEPKQIEMLLRNVPDTHLLYGSDTPYTDICACIGQAEALEQTEKLTAECGHRRSPNGRDSRITDGNSHRTAER